MAPSHPPVTTYFIVDNLHCPTCVSAIKDTLQNVEGVGWVSPNIVTSWVAIEHDPKVTPSEMWSKLDSAGFNISGVGSTNGEVSLAEMRRGDHSNGLHRSDTHYSLDLGERTTPWGRMIELSDMLSDKILPKKSSSTSKADKERKEKEHLKNCEKCRAKASKASKPITPNTTRINTTSNSLDDQIEGKQVGDEKSAEGLATSIQPLENEESVESEDVGHRWKVSMTISNIVCSSCVAVIAEPLNKRKWITKTSIDYLSKSGVFEYIGTKEDAKQIVEIIEDTGREAEIVQITNIDRGNNLNNERTVRIRIDGFYCEHCADRAANSLKGLPRNLKIESRPTREQPIMKLTYTPAGPKFTIRQILSVIEASDPAFKASVFHLPTLEERSKRLRAAERRKIAMRAWFTTAVVIPTFIIGVVYMSLVNEHNPSKMLLMEAWKPGISRAQFALCIMATPVYFFSANLFHRRAILEVKALWTRRPRRDGLRYMDDDDDTASGAARTKEFLQRFYRFGSMDMLVSLGTTIAYVSSISQMIAAAVDRPKMVNDANFYFDSVVFLTFFLLWGRFIEKYSESKLGDAVDALTKLRPTTAKLIEKITDNDEKEREVNVDMLDVGDIIRITNGASPPCDGKIVRGETSFDESSLTGESFPVSKAANDDVFAGTVNMDRPVLVQITGSAGQSMLDQIVAIVREGQAKPSQIQDLATRLTKYFVPFITLIAIITWLVWLILGLSGVIPGHFLDVSSGGWVVFSLQFAIAVFVVACPCGLGLAAPTAIFAGSALAAKHGILAKGGGHAFEKASRIDCVVFDKTGTLTMGGQPTITDSMVYPDDEVNVKQSHTLLAALRTVEDNSGHPIAKAIVSWCASQTLERVEVTDVQEIPGKGLKATYKTGDPPQLFDIIVGNEALMNECTVDITLSVATSLETWKKEGKSIALAAVKDAGKPGAYRIAAALAITDPVRRETPAVIRALQSAGKDVWMLSGDNSTTAKAVALRIGIPDLNVIAGVLPTEKHEKIKWLQQTLKARKGNVELTNRRAFIAMVGDGINDTAALSTADVGIAIGSGSDVAISSADFVLVNSNLESIVTLLDLSKAVFRRIKFNFAWALVYNLLAVPIAAGCFYAIMVNGQHVRLPPVWASLAMALSSISVVTSSLALRSGIPGLGFRVRKIFGPEDEVKKGGVYGFGAVKV